MTVLDYITLILFPLMTFGFFAFGLLAFLSSISAYNWQGVGGVLFFNIISAVCCYYGFMFFFKLSHSRFVTIGLIE